ncbi:MAG: site-specific integrase [Cytophagia bacterium]|nr:MAG: site-specific integrase [Cytophagales bacterium]TAG35119.1 MAG: site-specific integrase [Cytophagia bacterium]TAG77031.1 MAG: site-specific integrase [Cytophagales bacterium]
MAKITFYLRDKEAMQPTPIVLYFRYEKKTVKYPTGENVLPSHWKNECVLKKDSCQVEKNARLSKLKDTASDIFRRFVNDYHRQPSTDELRNEFDHHAAMNPKGVAVEKPLDLMGFIDQYLQDAKTRLNERTGKPIQKVTLLVYEQAYRILKEFKDLHYKRRPFSFEQINHGFYTKFQQFLIAEKKFSTNTVGKHIRTIKTFLLEAQECGHLSDFSPRKFRGIEERTDAIYLNAGELNAFFELDLRKQPPRLQRVRDLFIVGAWTGLRFSDFTRIKQENIKDGFITIQTQKTNETVVVPIHDHVQAIMNRYEGITENSLPVPLSNQRMNDYLKEIAVLANLNEPITETHTKGGQTFTKTTPKHELVTTHTARRSFATNHYLARFPTISIMKITGHRTEKAFMKYIKVTPREHAEALKDHWKQASQLAKETKVLKLA